MDVTPHASHKGEIVTLSCRGSLLGATAQLLPYTTIGWVTPMGTALTKENGITVSTSHNSNEVVSTLTINGTKYSHTGVYSCVVTLNANDSLSANAVEFHLTLKGKTW